MSIKAPRAIVEALRAGRKKPRQLEAPHQRALARWLDLCGVVWLHIPNGGARSSMAGVWLKQQGVKAGFPDNLILTRPPAFPDAPGTALELKPALVQAPYARPSAAQDEWFAVLMELGWLVVVAHGSSEAIAALRGMGYNERMRLDGSGLRPTQR